MQSMTGFATETCIIEHGTQRSQVTLHLKTLNARHFETNYRLPHQLFAIEPELLNLFREKFIRGTIHFYIHFENPHLFKGALVPDLTTVTNYHAALEQIRNTCNINEPIKLEHVLTFPSLIITQEAPASDALLSTVMHHIKTLVDRVVQERIREGQSLAKDLTSRVTNLLNSVHIVKQRAEEFIHQEREKIGSIIAELQANSEQLDEARNQALYAILEKMAIHEETVRLESHVHSLKNIISSDALEIGKRLDFTLQEMGREVNTIGAKSADSIISNQVIGMKLEIDKAREQALNIV